MRSRVLALVVFSLASTVMLAQSSAQPPEPEPTMQALLARIQQLEREVHELREHERQETAALTSSPGPPAPPESLAVQTSGPPPSAAAHLESSSHEHGPSMTEVREVETRYPSLQIRGFGDVNFAATDQKHSISGFNLGQFVLHFASPLSAKVSYFAEVSFTAQPTTYELAVERTIIRYDYNDYFKLSFGKYHTPVSYWNTAFHHGTWLETSEARPEMIKFGGTFIPVHFLGLLAEGSIPSGGLGLGYNVGLGNGRGGVFSKAGDSGDINNNRAWVTTVFARPARLYGLQVGGSFYQDKLTAESGKNFDEWIASAHVVYTKEHPEILSEFANVHHRDQLTSQIFDSQAYYVQLGYRLPLEQNKWKPYYRFEYIHRPRVEPVWDVASLPSVVDLVGSTVGVRYDITNYAAFKAEYRNSRHGVGEPRVNGAFVQTDFTF